jgi:hypothetical protein
MRRFYVGCVHPRPEVLAQFMDPEWLAKWLLSREKLASLGSTIIGCPITYSHAGYEEATRRAYAKDDTVVVPTPRAVRKELESLAKTNAKYIIGGSVLDYFAVPGGGYYIVFDVTDATLATLVDKGYTSGLSLTHNEMRHNNTIVPYEVTLCIVPQRPQCYVYATGRLQSLLSYKSKLMDGSIREPIMAPEIVNTDDDFDSALKDMSDAAATVIAAKFDTADKARQAAEDRWQKAEAALKEVEGRSAAETGMMKVHIDDLQTLLGEELCGVFNLGSAYEQVASGTPTMMRNGAGTLIAASVNKLRSHTLENSRLRALLGEKAVQDLTTSGAKRTRVEADLPEVAAVAAGHPGKQKMETGPPAGATPMERVKWHSRRKFPSL